MIQLPLPERFAKHIEMVRVVADAGVELPAEWLALSRRLDDYQALESTAAQRLAAQVVDPQKGVDMTLLRALALAELTEAPGNVAAMNREVNTAVETRMLEIYGGAAAGIYGEVAAKFDSAASELMACASVVDVNADPALLIAAPDEDQRQAWLSAAVAAAHCDALLGPLVAAAQLSGAKMDRADPNLAQQWWSAPLHVGAVIALCVDTTGLKVRDLYAAWDAEGRCGRFGALAKMGAQLRAAPLDALTPLPDLQPLRHRQVPLMGAPRGYVRIETTDPHETITEPITGARVDA